MSRLFIAVIAVLISSTALAEEIPLKSIWALDMPGTKSIYELEPGIYGDNRSAEEQIELRKKSLIPKAFGDLSLLKPASQAGPGRAVAGVGLQALQDAVKRKDEPLPEGEVSLLYFSHQSGDSINLHEVTREGEQITVRYRVVPRETQSLTAEFALIPLGKLSKGEYRVEIVQIPMEQRYLDAGFRGRDVSRIVCKAFSFTVE